MLIQEIKYQQMIQEATKTVILFPHGGNQEKKPTLKFQSGKKLQSSYPFRSSQQIENNMTITQQIIPQLSHQYATSLNDNWPKSCIGLVLCEHHQNNQTYYVYGTGILINKKLVLTSAQNVYCRRMNTQYTNIRFIVGISNDKCSEIYDVMIVHYPKEYTMQEYDNYNFSVLQLYNDLSNSCGYVGWKTLESMEEDERYTLYQYINTNQYGFFNLRSQAKSGKQQYCMERCLESGVLVKENNNKCSIVGLQQSKKQYILSEQIRNRINQWTEQILINLYCSHIDAYGYKYLSQVNLRHLTSINLSYNNICEQGCKYLSQANWTHLAQIKLSRNKIDAQGCKYLCQAKWTHLTRIQLYRNNINAQGCKYLSKTNWKHLTQIYLSCNNIGAQGCKYLIQANWIYLTTVDLAQNNIGTQGCKYLNQTNWTHLTQIQLYDNNIDAQGYLHLSQANWTHLAQIYLGSNNICDIIYQLLLEQSYPPNTKISIW